MSFNFSSVKAVAFGAVIGFAISLAPGCGPVKPISRCNVSNCDGCCDDSGQCQQGTSDTNCGSAASSCVSCDTGRSCLKLSADSDFGGRCNGGTGSGDGGVKDAGVVDAGICNPSTCPNGCCNGGSCVTVTTTARCGKSGAACAPCGSGNTCVAGACAACAGCVDISTGQCKSGAESTACGRNGGFCQTCDSAQQQACNNGVCSGGANCNATNCPNGCCDGATCKAKATYTNFQCGSGVQGTACVACAAGPCDLDAGVCIGGSGGGDDGGLGGIGLCDLSNCPTGCCDGAASAGVGVKCVEASKTCSIDTLAAVLGGNFALYKCNGSNRTCEQ